MFNKQKIISVKEARKLLGKGFTQLNDDEIESLINILEVVARGVIIESVPIL